jgi:5-methylcytosine-specific restriction protein A
MKRPTRAELGYDQRWIRIRAQYLKHNPHCQHPGCTEPATQVDHIKAKRDGGTDKWNNLRGYCHSHHSKRTARDQPGGWHAWPKRKRPATTHPGLTT